jgi:hypothetical protein
MKTDVATAGIVLSEDALDEIEAIYTEHPDPTA